MPTTDPTAARPLDIIAQEAAATAASFGVTCAADMAQALVERIVKRVGGQRIYIPIVSARVELQRSAQIRAQFAGNNLQELAHTYRVTPRQIRRLLASLGHAGRPKNP